MKTGQTIALTNQYEQKIHLKNSKSGVQRLNPHADTDLYKDSKDPHSSVIKVPDPKTLKMSDWKS